MDINTLNKKIEDLEAKLNVQKGRRDIVQKNLDSQLEKIENLKKDETILSQVEILLNKASEYGREQAKTQVESLVSSCLSFIFETDVEFVIELNDGKITGADFYVVSNYDGYTVKTQPETSRGGGIVDIISIALRIAMIEIYNPKIEGPLILDEPGKHVSEEYVFNLGEFLRRSSTMFHRQIIMVTHNKYLSEICDKSFLVEQKNSVSKVSPIENEN
ncbi:ATPase [Peptoniphilus asaccharolyticus]